MIKDAYNRELRKFDHERVLLAWDGLINQQQAALESYGVPAMFTSTEASVREVRKITAVYDPACLRLTMRRNSSELSKFYRTLLPMSKAVYTPQQGGGANIIFKPGHGSCLEMTRTWRTD
jgi:hypothetical protein